MDLYQSGDQVERKPLDSDAEHLRQGAPKDRRIQKNQYKQYVGVIPAAMSVFY